MIKLSKHIAQRIVDKMMRVIPYNVIITDEQGVIIGSGDKERIYKTHSAAQESLKLGKIVKTYEDNPSFTVKKGVNSPIFFQGKIVGVIGIAGDPDVVSAFSQLVSVTAELLINQEYTLNRRKIKEEQVEKFLYELSYKEEEYSEAFIERGLSLGIDLNIPYVAVVINFNELPSKIIKNWLNHFLEKDEHILILNTNTIIVFMNSDRNIIKRIKRCLDEEFSKDINIGLGLQEHIISNSVKQAVTAINIGKRLENNKNIFLYKDFRFISILAKFKDDYKFNNVVEKLKEEGKKADLLGTLAAYVYNNGEVNSTSEDLHIHRNTLNYRFEKIQQITGKNPRNIIELFELFTAYVVSML
jgi:carbohydrate diacid regulator